MGRHLDARPWTFAAWETGSGGPVTATAIRNRQQFYDRWIGGRTTEWLVRSSSRRKIAAVKGDPDVGVDRLLCEQVADRVDDGRHRLVLGEGAHTPGMVSVETEPMVNQIRCATRETRWPLSRVSACVT
jgi:hypothetical protein